MATSHAIQWALLDHAADRPVEVGDLVSVDAGGMPIFRVMALAGRQLRLADERQSAQVLPLDTFRWRCAAAA